MLIGCDTGGTFTDFVLFDPEQPELGLRQLKLSSTPANPAEAVLAGVRLLAQGRPGEESNSSLCERVHHASTVATNALLEGSLSDVSLLTTQGFEDNLWLGRGDRRELYSLRPGRVQPPLSRGRVLGVDERILVGGRVETPLTDQGAHAIVSALDQQVKEVAVLLLHSSFNPEHELKLEALLKAKGFQAFLSHKIAPGSGEYSRGMTTVLAAALASKVQKYLQSLAQALREAELSIVHSAGGLITPEEAVERPHRLALSGPAAGLRGAQAVSQACQLTDIVTLDMGGTSTDVALLSDGELPYCWQSEISGYPLRAPALDIHTVGAGGGSLAWIDGGGLLRVGPKSAGANPGPACYGRGGELATVTDALCWSGLLPEELGSEKLKLQRQLSHRVLSSTGRQLELHPDAVAEGILSVCTAHLSRAVRRVTTAVGRDPKNFSLFPFGGAGPLLACRVADSLQIGSILVPDSAGVLSAWGALVAPWEKEWSHSVEPSQRTNPQFIDQICSELRLQAGSVSTDARFETLVARRYSGQGETLMSRTNQNFHELHQDRFGFSRLDCQVETIEVRLRQTIVSPAARDSITSKRENQKLTNLGKRQVLTDGKESEISVFSGAPEPSQTVDGPFLLFTSSSTVFVADDWTAKGLEGGHLHLERESI